MDLRLVRPDGGIVRVPGFFAGDGAGGGRGSVWKVRFTPPAIPGSWSATAILRYGEAINLDTPNSTAGIPVFGRTLRLLVDPPDLGAPGFFARGPIEADGAGRLRHADRSLFVKAGVGSPENFLGYAGFDGAVDGIDGGPPGEFGGAPDFLHEFEAHRGHWRAGDPDWGGGRGRPIIGALNDLADLGANAIYVMPMNLGGDGRDTFPFVSNSGGARFPADPADALNYAVRRLSQWDLVLRHAQARGILVQLVLAEREPTNIDWLGGAMSTRRRLFLKQLAAHFGYLPGLEWTLCEENAAPGASTFAQFTPLELRDMATWIRGWDHLRHPRSVHVDYNDLSLYSAMIASGAANWIDCVSLQISGDEAGTARLYGDLAEDVAGRFLNIGRRVVVHIDEPGYYLTGAGSELHPNAWANAPHAGTEDRRRRVLYDSLFSGAGLLWYFGLYPLEDGGGDLHTEDFRTRATLLRQTTIARELIETTFRDVGQFGAADDLWTSAVAPLHPVYGDAEVLAQVSGPLGGAQRDRVLVYLPALGPSASVSPGRLAPLWSGAPGTRTFRATWINPRTGIEQGPDQFFDPTQAFWPEPPAGAPLNPDVDWVLRVTPL
ncbi:hypothetical protein Poly30_12150 [Planctomycetes bacterium Poly30]|uniref:Uncharacterized protein n=2 Tax=Saltatorellus ferox TaxID=2528018 RepID=A0A518ENQ0_9BACT|nr:hypothetical protein Poly30_12150 [Planctomycetes bacterium Poly30]